jgi:transcriptional regulator with XRE-family HTH domain
MATFSELMRRQRKLKSITLTALASEVGYHASYLSLVERGRRRLDPLDDQQIVAARVFGILALLPVAAVAELVDAPA